MTRYTDQAGRVFEVMLPENCTDEALGHIIGPPVLDARILKLDTEEILVRLHNELLVRGIITAHDTTQRGAPGVISDAIRAATSPIISVSDVIAAYREEETEP